MGQWVGNGQNTVGGDARLEQGGKPFDLPHGGGACHNSARWQGHTKLFLKTVNLTRQMESVTNRFDLVHTWDRAHRKHLERKRPPSEKHGRQLEVGRALCLSQSKCVAHYFTSSGAFGNKTKVHWCEGGCLAVTWWIATQWQSTAGSKMFVFVKLFPKLVKKKSFSAHLLMKLTYCCNIAV